MPKKGVVPPQLRKYLFKKKHRGGSSMSRKGKKSGSRMGRARSYFRKAYSGAVKHKIPLTATFLGAGAIVTIFNLLPNQRAQLFNELNALLASMGISVRANGYTIAAVLVGLGALAAIFPVVGVKMNAILGRYGVKL